MKSPIMKLIEHFCSRQRFGNIGVPEAAVISPRVTSISEQLCSAHWFGAIGAPETEAVPVVDSWHAALASRTTDE
jgi:hypothetical protein